MQESTSVVLKQFTDKPLYDASCDLLHYFKISFVEVTADPIPFEQLYIGARHTEMPKGLKDVVDKVDATYYIGQIDNESLLGHGKAKTNEEIESLTRSGKYSGLMVFAVDISADCHITRSEMAVLTRGFNRTVSAQPVVLIIRQGNTLSLSTCERMEYTQQWRDGQKLGKVSILRDINCLKPHHGHIDILEELGNKQYTTFDELYENWMRVFSSEVLTEKFYGELSDWYAWAIQEVRFPNDITTDSVDKKMNDMAVIRMITRLIFVWFLYCKKLIPKEFFEIDNIRELFIDEFAPKGDAPLIYDPNQSRYYRVILQNLFFAMLNRPIVAEGKDIANNRRFVQEQEYHGMNPDYNVNNLMHYREEFKPGGADEFLKMANSRVPFLNGGLFDCLDDKPNKKFYDGFSGKKASLSRLHVPDYLFFGGTEDANLFDWYHVEKKKHVRVEGLIDIFHRYYFTVEENTPLDQEVSLDPELLGKAFENLLAAYVPETGTNARKQTGSFYTPREVVHYMVVESLVAHLKRICGDDNEKTYRELLSYTDEEVVLTDELRRNIMLALYNCQILDPACGSGAFPMGMLQTMVHVLRRIDPDNKMWHDLMVEQAKNQVGLAFETDDEKERKERIEDIENAFNKSINDPDYARKLYLIENCIYGVDIQPMAIQISKLRFFISLIVDQRPTADAAKNFGIRPLPNLEANFVAANTLIPVDYDSSLVDGNPQVQKYKKDLKELNHKVFLAGRNHKKEQLKEKIKETRANLAKAIEDTGFVLPSVANLLASWDMFDQNSFATFFDAEWMLGIKDGFDIVIGNPPYGVSIKDDYRKNLVSVLGKVPDFEIYYYFIVKARQLLEDNGILSYIIPNTYLFNMYAKDFRKNILNQWHILEILDCTKFPIFKSAVVRNTIILWEKLDGGLDIIGYRSTANVMSFSRLISNKRESLKKSELLSLNQNWGLAFFLSSKVREIIYKISSQRLSIKSLFPEISQGLIAYDKYKGQSEDIIKNRAYHFDSYKPGLKKWLWGEDVVRYYVKWNGKEYIDYCDGIANPRNPNFFKGERLLIREITNPSIYAAIINEEAYNDPSIIIVKGSEGHSLKVLEAILNSKLATFYHFNHSPKATKGAFPKILVQDIKDFPLPNINSDERSLFENFVNKIKVEKNSSNILENRKFEQRIDFIVYHLYGLTYDEVLIVDPQTPITREEYEKEGMQVK